MECCRFGFGDAPAYQPARGELPRETRGSMNYPIIAALALLAGATTAAQADPANALGRAVGSFSSGVSQAAMQPLINSQPQWITIAPRSKEECFAESNGVINATFVRCRRGCQELTRFDAAGNRVVLSERGIPEW